MNKASNQNQILSHKKQLNDPSKEEESKKRSIKKKKGIKRSRSKGLSKEIEKPVSKRQCVREKNTNNSPDWDETETDYCYIVLSNKESEELRKRNKERLATTRDARKKVVAYWIRNHAIGSLKGVSEEKKIKEKKFIKDKMKSYALSNSGMLKLKKLQTRLPGENQEAYETRIEEATERTVIYLANCNPKNRANEFLAPYVRSSKKS